MSTYQEKLYAQIVEQVKANKLPWTKSWKTNQLKYPVSFASGKDYNGLNIFTLFPDGEYLDNRWITFNEAKKNNASILKGEKSRIIQYWNFVEKTNEANELVADDTKNFCFAKYSRVWNIEQINGIDPLVSKLDLLDQEWENEDIVESILTNSGADIRTGGQQPMYNITDDYIKMPEKARFSTAEDYYAAALHELAHWTGHKTRLNRYSLYSDDERKYAIEELKAELTSYFLSMELGIPFDPSKHIKYISHWEKALIINPDTLIIACREATKMKKYIMDFADKNIKKDI